MRPPSFRTWLLGSRFTAPFIILGCAYHTSQWWQAGTPDNSGIVTLALLFLSAKAAYTVAAHRRWRADWQAMGGQTSRPSRAERLLKLALLLGVIGFGAAYLVPEALPLMRDWIALVVGVGLLLGLARLILRLVGRCWPRRQQAKIQPVAIAVRRPVRRPISMASCYRRLPPYCKLLLHRGRP